MTTRQREREAPSPRSSQPRHGSNLEQDDSRQRLQLDTQFALISRLSPLPPGLQPPDFLSLFRIGLIPGFLDDPNRPILDTGPRLNVALGGSPLSSQSATMLGNLYIFEGWLGVVVFAVLLTLIMRYAINRDNPWALSFVALIYWYGISFNASYPDVIPKLLQASLSMLVAYVLVRLLSRPRPDTPAKTGRRHAAHFQRA